MVFFYWAFPDWLSRDWPYLLPPTGIFGLLGALAHPKVRKWVSVMVASVVHPGKLIKENILAQEKAQRFAESALYWEESHKELTDRFDDLDARLKRTIAETAGMLHELKEVRIQAERRKDAMKRLSQDREAAIYHIGVLECEMVEAGLKIPERPDWQSSGYDVLMPDSLGP